MTYSILLRTEKGDVWALKDAPKCGPGELVIAFAQAGMTVVHLLPIPNFKGASA